MNEIIIDMKKEVAKNQGRLPRVGEMFRKFGQVDDKDILYLRLSNDLCEKVWPNLNNENTIFVWNFSEGNYGFMYVQHNPNDLRYETIDTVISSPDYDKDQS